MAAMKDFDVTRLAALWQKAGRVPMARRLFSKSVGLIAPYTATIDPEVLEFEPGHARVRMADRRAVRNHLRSIHAVALVNLAELTGNLAIIAAMPRDTRMIVKGLSIEYLKKARGALIATATCALPAGSAKQDLDSTVDITDGKGELVARAVVKSVVAPKRG